MHNSQLDLPLDQDLYQQPGIAGVDEVGRGPLVGAVVAAAVILDPKHPIDGLADSKKLSAKRREHLSEQIREHALAWCIAECSPAEIDQLNILWATMLAMERAVAGLQQTPLHIYIDGNRCPKDLPVAATAVIKGDSKVPAISAASIIAKVARDHDMERLHQRHPQYGFAQHKGYPTRAHLDALQAHGPLPEHRRSFGPVARLLQQQGR